MIFGKSFLMIMVVSHSITLYSFASRNDFIYSPVEEDTTDKTLQYVGITRVCCDPEIIFIYKKLSSSKATHQAKSRVMSFYSQQQFKFMSDRFNTVVGTIQGCYTGSPWHLLVCAFKKKFLEWRSTALQRQMSKMISNY